MKKKKAKEMMTTSEWASLNLKDGVEYPVEELQEFADRVGVGYKGLDAVQLLTKLQSAGVPV